MICSGKNQQLEEARSTEYGIRMEEEMWLNKKILRSSRCFERFAFPKKPDAKMRRTAEYAKRMEEDGV